MGEDSSQARPVTSRIYRHPRTLYIQEHPLRYMAGPSRGTGGRRGNPHCPQNPHRNGGNPQNQRESSGGTGSEGYLGHAKWCLRLGAGHRERGVSMLSFRRTAKPARRGDNQNREEEPQQAAFDAAASAEAARLRDLDPVHTFTATAELRRQDERYAEVWPSDIPQRRRRQGK
jgi:hypothetical protein